MNTDLPDLPDSELKIASSPDLSFSITNQEVRDCLMLLWTKFRHDWILEDEREHMLTTSAALARAMGKSFEENIELLKNRYFRITVARISARFDEFLRTGKVQ
jgi:hypothetical protein